MKRLITITLCLLAAALVAVTAWHLRPAPSHAPGKLFSRYEHQPGVRVGFLADFALGDSLRADVVTLEALDSAGWLWMQSEFAFPQLDARRDSLLATGTDVLQTWILADGSSVAFLSRLDSALCIVQTDSEQQFEKVFMYHLQKMKEQ